MAKRRKYIKRSGTPVVAVQLALDTDGFTYRKWGGVQTCKRGDWIVNNNGDVYSVDRSTFERTYSPDTLGTFRKVTPVWAEIAEQDGAIPTKEGETQYKAGSYIVCNDEQGNDSYAMDREAFEKMYEPAE
jgi:hypothetical protein